MTTREDVMLELAALCGRALASLGPGAVVRAPSQPVEFALGETLFTLPEADGVERLSTIGNRPPFYMTDRIEIEVAVADDGAALIARLIAALGALDAELEADATLGGTVKGRDWTVSEARTDTRAGASPERSAEVIITVEYESASRLAI